MSNYTHSISDTVCPNTHAVSVTVLVQMYIDIEGTQTKRPKQNAPRDKTSQDKTSQDIRSKGQNVPRHKVQGTNVPGDKMSQKTKRPRDKMSQDKTSHTEFSKTHFVLENWPHMLGNGPHPCNQFMIGVFLFWEG